MTANTDQREIVAFLTNQMSQLTSFSDMFNLYLINRNILKYWTFIVATTEKNNMDLYEGLNGISGIRERMFTPFTNGRVSIINDKILERCLTQNDSRARIFRCVSFDTQTVSYIERYYKNGTATYNGFESVIQLLKGEKIGVDYIPYTIENLLFDTSRKSSVEQTLFAYEMMCSENTGNEKKCRKRAQAITSMYEEGKLNFTIELKTQYQMIYLSLLKMSQIQLEHSNMPAEKKLQLFIDFIVTKLYRMLQPEINLAKVYFTMGSSCGFFGKIHIGNKNILNQLKNMTWDLMHLRFMDYSSMFFNVQKGDALIPFFFTYDKRLLDIRECYNLQALAINPYNYSTIPLYTVGDGILDIIKEHCTLEKHTERMQQTPDIEPLILECEQDLLKLIQKLNGMIKRKIIKNSIQCNICGDIIESRFRHHYVECSCGACFVDGGHAYQRIGYTEEGCYTDLSIIKEVNYIQERYKTYPKAQSKTSDKNSEFKNTEHKS